jgi:hypothetical protein
MGKGERKPCSVVSADFHGVNTSTMAGGNVDFGRNV